MGEAVQSADVRALDGRRAMIVGAETAVGAAIARALSEGGARVALVTMRVDEGVVVARRLQRELRERGAEVHTFAMDVALGQNVKVTTRQVTKELGGLDVAVSAPDQFLERPLRTVSEMELAQITSANYYAHAYLARAAADEFRRGGGGRLLLVTHALGVAAVANASTYGGACAATLGLIRGLAVELGADGVAVSGLLRGTTRWGAAGADASGIAEETRSLGELLAATDAAEAERLAETARSLLVAPASDVHGRVFDIDAAVVAGVGG